MGTISWAMAVFRFSFVGFPELTLPLKKTQHEKVYEADVRRTGVGWGWEDVSLKAIGSWASHFRSINLMDSFVWGFLKDKVSSAEPTTDKLKIAMAQEVASKPAAQVGRTFAHLKGVNLS